MFSMQRSAYVQKFGCLDFNCRSFLTVIKRRRRRQSWLCEPYTLDCHPLLFKDRSTFGAPGEKNAPEFITERSVSGFQASRVETLPSPAPWWASSARWWPVSRRSPLCPSRPCWRCSQKKQRRRRGGRRRGTGGQRDVAEGENLPLVRETPAEGDCASDSNPVDSFLKVQCVI